MIALIVICIVSLITKTSCQQPTYHLLTPRHGMNDGRSSNSIMCPANGAFIGIKYSFTGSTINSLEFTCLSLDGPSTIGPFGIVGGSEGRLDCPSQQYVSSLYGNAGATLTNLGVRCRHISEKLKGDGTDIGKIRTDTATPAFDDFAYANGARPVGVIIWTESDRIEAIQFDYANIPVELCTGNCTVYKEESATLHGTANGSGLKIAVVICPKGGAINEIKTRVARGEVQALQFGCTSGLGTTQTEVFGQSFGTSTLSVTTIKCPPGMIVGSIHGYYGKEINALGIRCVVAGELGVSPKFDAQGGTAGTAFDDVQYSNRGWRPVQLHVYHGTNGIYGIQVKYANAKVATNCKVTGIEVTDSSVQAKFDGIELIGAATAVSCWNGAQLLKMEYSKVVVDSVTIGTTAGGEINFGGSLSVTGTAGVSMFGAKVEVSSGITQSVGGSKQWSTTNSNAASTSMAKSSGTGITYTTPGACALIGYVKRYKVDQNNVNVRYHYECETGELPYELGRIYLQATTYGNVYFRDYQYEFPNITACTKESRTCVKNLNGNNLATDSDSFLTNFFECLF